MLIERLSSEKAAAEEETRRILQRAFSEAEANEMGDAPRRGGATRRRGADAPAPAPAAATPSTPKPTHSPTPHTLRRPSQVKALRQRLAQYEDKEKIGQEQSTSLHERLELAHTERDRAQRELQKAHATLQTKLGEIDALERRVALLTHDTGVSPVDLERALAMVRDANEPPAPAAGSVSAAAMPTAPLKLADTDLNKLGLEPLVKRQVQEVLMQNNDLIMSLEKTEQLLAIAQKTSTLLRAELDAAKARSQDETALLQRQLAGRNEALSKLKEDALRASSGIRGGPPATTSAPLLPMPVEADVAGEGSIISDGTTRARRRGRREHVRAADRVGEAAARVLRGDADDLPLARLLPARHAGDADAPGALAQYDFTAQYVLTVDDLFLHYISTTSLTLEVHQSWGVEAQMVARADCPCASSSRARRRCRRWRSSSPPSARRRAAPRWSARSCTRCGCAAASTSPSTPSSSASPRSPSSRSRRCCRGRARRRR